MKFGESNGGSNYFWLLFPSPKRMASTHNTLTKDEQRCDDDNDH